MAALADSAADLVVVDCMLFGVMEALASPGRPYLSLEHLYDAFFRRGHGSEGRWAWACGCAGSLPQRLARGVASHLVASLPAPRPGRAQPRPDVTYVGPVVVLLPSHGRGPCGPGEPQHVSSSRRCASRCRRCLDATAGLDARVVVTTGPVIDPAVAAAGGQPRAAPVRAACGADALDVSRRRARRPLDDDAGAGPRPADGRDADAPDARPADGGQSLERAGAGRVLVSKETSVEDLRAAVTDLLADGPHRAAAARLGAAIRAMPGATNGADQWRPCSETEQGRQVAPRLDRELVHAEPARRAGPARPTAPSGVSTGAPGSPYAAFTTRRPAAVGLEVNPATISSPSRNGST